MMTLPGFKASKAKEEERQPEDSKSFSIVLGGGSAIHLEVPLGGNGRSRDEWVAAFQDLADDSYSTILETNTNETRA